MVCLIKDLNKTELELYKNILGSEAAAYYVLAMNNGYMLDKDPNGKPSLLYSLILQSVGGDVKKAILEKSAYYSQAYLNANGNWLLKDTIVEPQFTGLNSSMPVQSVVSDILTNDEYTKIKTSLESCGIDDPGYAMRTAIERTRKDYLDYMQSKFQHDYVLEQAKAMQARNFFQKVLAFIRSPFNFNKIKEPSSEQSKNARDEAFKQFNDTLEYLITSGIYEQLNKLLPELAKILHDKHLQNDKKYIYTVIQMMDVARSNGTIILNNDNVNSILLVLKDTNNSLYTDGIAKYGNQKALVKALLQNDTNDDYIKSFILELKNGFVKDLKDAITSNANISDLILMYTQYIPYYSTVNTKAYDVIKQGIESRLISIKKGRRGVKKEVQLNLQNTLYDLQNKSVYDLNDMYDMYIQFIDNAREELSIQEDILKEYLAGSREIDADIIMYMQTDVIGYYDYIIKNFISNLDETSGFSSQQLDDIKQKYTEDINETLGNVLSLYNSVLDQYCDSVLDRYVDENYTLGDIENHKRTLKAAIRNLIDKGNVQVGEQLFGDATQSKSEVVRIIANMLNNDERETNRLTNNVGHKLLELYTKAEPMLSKLGLNPNNYMKTFCEMDDQGLPTGYFVRGYSKNGKYHGVNYGQFEKNKRQFEDKLRRKYKLASDGHGNTIWNLDIRGQKDIYNKYMDELDDWLDENCERRYTKEYYKNKRRILTYEASRALDQVSRQILIILDQCTDEDGFVYLNKLSQPMRSKLKNLQNARQELGNPYSIIVDPQSKKIVKFESKKGEQLEIALSIIKWNKFLSDKIKKEPNWDKYNAALSKITDEDERKQFIADNSHITLSNEFYDLVSQCSTATLTEEYHRLSAAKNKILNITKNNKGYYMPDLGRLTDEMWAELKRLDEEMLLHKVKGEKGSVSFDEIATLQPVTIKDPNDPSRRIPYIMYLKQQAQLSGQDALQDFYNKYFYLDNKGQLKPLSVFYYLSPLDSKYVIRVPNSEYSLTVGGEFVNPNYDNTNKDMYQPNTKKYKNDMYEKIMSNDATREFFEYLLLIMQESISLLPSDVDASIYKMPQITDNSMSIISRNLLRMNMTGAAKSLTLHLVVNENDTDIYREDLSTRPNGAVVETIPIRFIKSLEDPSLISCDIVGTVMQFYSMAKNFELKSKTVPVVEALISKMGGGISHSDISESGQYKRAKTLVEMYGYGHMTRGFGDTNKKMSGTDKFITKQMNNFRSVSNVALLAWNLFSATKGFIAAYYQTGVEAFVGRYYDCGDRFWTSQQLVKEVGNAVLSLGQGNTRSKVQAAMQYNGLASSTQHSFSNKDKTNIRRFFEDHFKMGIFSIGDYSTNAIVMMSTYHATRLIPSPFDSSMQFMNEEECIDMFLKHGKTRKEAMKYFDEYSNNHLYNMYELTKNGSFVLKDSVQVKSGNTVITIDPHDYVTKKIENRISSSSERRASVINGVVSQHGKTKFHQGTLTKLLAVMRGYLFSQGWDRLKRGDDFSAKYYDEKEVRTMGMDETYRGQYDLETGHCEYGMIYSVLQLFENIKPLAHDLIAVIPLLKHALNDPKKQSKLRQVDILNILHLLLDVVGVITFGLICSLIFIPAAKKYPDEWWASFGALVSSGVALELSTSISPTTILDLFTTVTTAYSFLKDFLKTIDFMKELFGFGDHDRSEVVRSGPYKDKPRWFRDAMKAFGKPSGITGMYESFTPYIPGLDDLSKSEYGQQNERRISRLKKQGFVPTSLDDLYDLYRIGTTPIGLLSKYNWYHGNTFPVTIMPSLKDEDDDTVGKSKSSSGKKNKNRKNSKSNKSKNK